MALLGISSSDVINYSWNTSVGCGVCFACAGIASLVKIVVEKAFAQSQITQQNQKTYSQYAGAAVGFGAAVATYFFIPGSRFALIISKSFSPAALIFGPVGLLATRCGYLVLAGFGAVGAGVGSGLIKG